MSRVSDVARPNSVETTNLEHVTQNIHALEQQRGSHSSRRVSGGIMSSKPAPTDPLKTCADRPATVRALAFSCPPRFLSRPIGTPPHAAGLRDDRNFCPALPPRHRGTTTPTRHPRLNVRRTWSVAQPVFGDRKLVARLPRFSHTTDNQT